MNTSDKHLGNSSSLISSCSTVDVPENWLHGTFFQISPPLASGPWPDLPSHHTKNIILLCTVNSLLFTVRSAVYFGGKKIDKSKKINAMCPREEISKVIDE